MQVTLSGPADPERLQPVGTIALESGTLNLVATQVRGSAVCASVRVCDEAWCWKRAADPAPTESTPRSTPPLGRGRERACG